MDGASEEKVKVSAADIRDALRQMGSYIDVTEDDLLKIYEIALAHAKKHAGREIPVSEVMTRDVISVGPEATIAEMSALMAERHISGLPVVDCNRLAGIVTEADLLARACVKRGRLFRRTLGYLFGEPVPFPRGGEGERAKDIMNPKVITATPEDDIKTAAGIMDKKRIKRLPVLDAEGKLVGIISRADVVRAIGK